MDLDFNPLENMSKFAYYYSKINKIGGLLLISKIAKNWYEILLFRVGLKKHVKIRFKDGTTFYANDLESYFNFWASMRGQKLLYGGLGGEDKNLKIGRNMITFNYKGKMLQFLTNADTLSVIKETFIEELYKNLNVKGNIVIDIGANVGDTAIYFALNGAKHVYAFEPYPYSYNIAKKNIKLNKLEDKITLLNEGCGKSGFITIKEDYESGVGTDLKNFNEGKKIKISSLDEIVKRFNLKHVALKIDCEGCEYAIILNASDDALKAFDKIVLEYHYGYKNLVNRLRRADFKIKRTLPKYHYNLVAENKDMYVGLIYCRR